MKKIIALALVIALCAGFAACSLTDKDNQTSSTSSTSSTTETTLSTTADIAYVSTIDVSVTSDADGKTLCPYEFLNATHTYMDGYWFRGTGRESTLNLADTVSLMPRMKIKNGFKINAPEDVNLGKAWLYNLDGTEIANAREIDSKSISSHMQSGTEYIAKFYANRKTVSGENETTSYYIYYFVVSFN